MAAELPKRGPGCKDCGNLDSCVFSGLGEEELSQAAQIIQQTSYAKGEVIFHQGSPVLGHHILCRGKAKLVRRTESGKKKLLRFYSPGELIGGLMDTGIYDAYAETLEDSLVSFMEKADFADLLCRYPQVSLEAIRRLSRELEALQRRLAALSYKGVRERLSDLLLELGREYGIEQEGGLFIDLRLSPGRHDRLQSPDGQCGATQACKGGADSSEAGHDPPGGRGGVARAVLTDAPATTRAVQI